MGKIKCPYCFEEFESDKVLFRANTGFTQEELDREEFTSGDVDEHKRLFVKFSQRNPDEKLDRYWTSRGGTAGYSSADPRWNMPHIDPNDADRFWEMTLTPTAWARMALCGIRMALPSGCMTGIPIAPRR